MRIGTYHTLKVLSKKEFGVYLEVPGEERGILLPAKQVPKGVKIGDELRVFVYRDSQDRLIATTNTPKITIGKIKLLTVSQVTRFGAFLEWGMEKELLLPFKEQQGVVQAGQQVLVTMYEDRSGRLCASMRVHRYLITDSPYKKGDMVQGVVYGINPQMGVFIAVDQQYFGLLPNQYAYGKYKLGDTVSLRVTEVRWDGKLNLAEGMPAYQQMETDAKKILKALDEFGGELPFGDKASPDIIKREFSMSKAAFKRALGHLYKEGKVILEEDCVRLTDSVR